MEKHSSNTTLPPLEIDDANHEEEQVSASTLKQPLLPTRTAEHEPTRSTSTSTIESIVSSTNSNDSDQSTEIPQSNLDKKRKQIINRAKAMPITQTQKRARWVPGHRYMPLLILQWFWHPIAIFIQSSRKAMSGSGHVNDNKLHSHDGHHHHHYHHHHNNAVHSSSVGHGATSNKSNTSVFVVGNNGGDLFLE
jgi:hypothetical protein